jgi:GntR family carbon starvation induced transcriptional regulator
MALARKTPLKDKQSASLPAAEATDSTRALYLRLRDDIVNAVHEPSHKLRFEEMCSRYDVSFGKFRETLLQLSVEGLVKFEQRRGFAVAPVSVQDLWDVTRSRIDLECRALTDAIANGGDRWEAEIVTSLHMLLKIEMRPGADQSAPDSGWSERHQAFHRALLSACSSRWTLRFCDTLSQHAQRYRQLSLMSSKNSRNAHEEHAQLGAAVLARDTGKAVALLSEHYERTATRAAAVLPASARG